MKEIVISYQSFSSLNSYKLIVGKPGLKNHMINFLNGG